MKVSNVKVYDLQESIKASKYPMSVEVEECSSEITKTVRSLATSDKGSGHDQFLTGIRVAFDLRCSNKMWVEMERYRFVEFVSSQSTMHRIGSMDIDSQCNEYVLPEIVDIVNQLVSDHNNHPTEKSYLTLLYNVPSGLELTARLTTNYRALKTVYSQRRYHRLPEWRKFCEWIETLPYSYFITEGEE